VYQNITVCVKKKCSSNIPAVIRDNTTLREVIVRDFSRPNTNCSI